MTVSSCARTASASPSTLCVTMTVTVLMALTSPLSVVSLGLWWEVLGLCWGTSLTAPSPPRVPDLWPQ
jgi:hypothetical protein